MSIWIEVFTIIMKSTSFETTLNSRLMSQKSKNDYQTTKILQYCRQLLVHVPQEIY